MQLVSIYDLYNGFRGQKPNLDVSTNMYIILSLGLILKFFLFIYCRYINIEIPSDMIAALAEDHLNDIFSNIGAIITLAIAVHTVAWWMDPIGAIVISIIIIYRWVSVMSEQVKKVVGYTAPPEFILQVRLKKRRFIPLLLYKLYILFVM